MIIAVAADRGIPSHLSSPLMSSILCNWMLFAHLEDYLAISFSNTVVFGNVVRLNYYTANCYTANFSTWYLRTIGNIILTLFILYQTLFIDTIFFSLLFYLYRVAPCYQNSIEFNMYVRFIWTFKMFIFTI